MKQDIFLIIFATILSTSTIEKIFQKSTPVLKQRTIINLTSAQQTKKSTAKQTLSELNELITSTGLTCKILNDNVEGILYEGINISSYNLIIYYLYQSEQSNTL